MFDKVAHNQFEQNFSGNFSTHKIGINFSTNDLNKLNGSTCIYSITWDQRIVASCPNGIQFLKSGIFGFMKNNRLNISNTRISSKFKKAIEEMSEDKNILSKGPYVWVEEKLETIFSCNLIRVASNPEIYIENKDDRRAIKPKVALIINWQNNSLKMNHLELVENFQLTPSEIHLLEALANNYDLKDYAKHKNITINTVRDRLKNIFQKTGTNKQSTLLKLSSLFVH